MNHRKVGLSVMDDEAGSVSSDITDACSEITDVSLETSASGAFAGVGAGRSYAKHSKEDEDFLMSMHWCSRAERREREQLGREVQQRLDYVRWEERQEGKWEAAAAAVVMAAAAAAAGVQARWWVRKGRARQRRRRATAAAAAAATAAAAAAATAVRSGWAEAAPASLCRRAERVLHSQLRHGGRGLRLGGGGKRGWVT